MNENVRASTRVKAITAALMLIVGILILSVPMMAKGEPAHILVHRGSTITTLNCTNVAGDWGDFPTYIEGITGTELTFRHDDDNLYILAKYSAPAPSQQDYWGIEFDNNGDERHMGSSASPDDSIFMSMGCPDHSAIDSYLVGFAQPRFDESRGGTNDAYGLMSYDNGVYTIQITRPFVTGDSLGNDVDLYVGMQIGVGFVVGTYGQGAAHKGTDMSTYVLSISNETSGGGGVVTLKPTNYMGLAADLGLILILATLGLIIFHFVRRKAWRPRLYESKEDELKPLVFAEVNRHGGGMRFSHWAHVSLMAGLLVTGWSIHDKSYILGSSTTIVHLIIAFAIAFIDFPVHFLAMWREGEVRNILLPTKDDFKVAAGVTSNFFFLSKKYPEHATWNPKENKYYLDRKYCSYQKFLLYGDLMGIIAMGVTGMALYWPDTFNWIISFIGGPGNIRALHLFIFFYFGASIMGHLYLSLIPANIGRLKAMTVGKGRIRVHTKAEESRVILDTPQTAEAAESVRVPPQG